MKAKRKKATADKSLCVACGSCAKACPRKAIEIFKGIYAAVREERCVGCGICARICPASVITIIVREAENG